MTPATIAAQLRAQIPASTDPLYLERMARHAAGGPKRIQRSRGKGSRLPPGTLCCTRPSKWGNRFRVGERVAQLASRRTVTPRNAEHCVELFRREIEFFLRQHPDMLEPLRGRDLACWCRLDAPCHVDVLLDLANRPRP